MDIVKNRNYHFDLTGQISFGEIDEQMLYEIFKDGRNASFMLELYLTKKFPLKLVKGNKDHDHIDNDGNKYDVKNFTKNGLKFMPSNQIGAGRCFDQTKAHDKANILTYICCDIVDFPKITIRFIDGCDLIKEYPKCSVPFNSRNKLFKYIV